MSKIAHEIRHIVLEFTPHELEMIRNSLYRTALAEREREKFGEARILADNQAARLQDLADRLEAE